MSKSYRQIFKATSVFGGVQVFSIVINIIRYKFLAVLLGPAGMGIAALFTETLNLVRSVTSFGLSTSAVKTVATAYAVGDEKKISQVVSVLKKWVWMTGIFGFVVALALSPVLSRLVFGSTDYALSFALLAITVLLADLSAGQAVILQGTRKIRYLAKSGILGSLLGLITSIPLYYFFGSDGIVPAILITTLSALLLSWYFSNKVIIPTINVSRSLVISQGRQMMQLGFMLSLSGIITLAASYLVRIYISRSTGLADVGLYNAGFAIINSYAGLILAAMATDYFPRLSGVAHDNKLAASEINQQAEIAILILSPILCIFLVYIDWAVILLYSEKFIAIKNMIHWAALGMYFKAACWAAGFLLLAKGNAKGFFWNELIVNAYLLCFNLVGYHYWGLTGLGLSFLLTYILYLVQIAVVARRWYGFRFKPGFLRLFAIQVLLGVACFLVVKLSGGMVAYIAGSVIILLSTLYSLSEMNKRLDLKSMLKSIRQRVR